MLSLPANLADSEPPLQDSITFRELAVRLLSRVSGRASKSTIVLGFERNGSLSSGGGGVLPVPHRRLLEGNGSRIGVDAGNRSFALADYVRNQGHGLFVVRGVTRKWPALPWVLLLLLDDEVHHREWSCFRDYAFLAFLKRTTITYLVIKWRFYPPDSGGNDTLVSSGVIDEGVAQQHGLNELWRRGYKVQILVCSHDFGPVFQYNSLLTASNYGTMRFFIDGRLREDVRLPPLRTWAKHPSPWTLKKRLREDVGKMKKSK